MFEANTSPLVKRCLQFVNYIEMIAAAEEKVKRKSGTQIIKP
jgi:hypothetical protein